MRPTATSNQGLTYGKRSFCQQVPQCLGNGGAHVFSKSHRPTNNCQCMQTFNSPSLTGGHWDCNVQKALKSDRQRLHVTGCSSASSVVQLSFACRYDCGFTVDSLYSEPSFSFSLKVKVYDGHSPRLLVKVLRVLADRNMQMAHRARATYALHNIIRNEERRCIFPVSCTSHVYLFFFLIFWYAFAFPCFFLVGVKVAPAPAGTTARAGRIQTEKT